MKPIKFNIDIKAQDCYLYGGHIFIVTDNGELIFCSFTKFVKQLINFDSIQKSFLRLNFLRNDYLKNTQADYFFSIPNFRAVFDNIWANMSANDPITLKVDSDNFGFIDKIPELPVYEMKAYAMRLYISTKKGMYETELKTESDGYNLKPSKLKKVFDEKVIGINAKSGTIFASAGTEGLFHGNFSNKTNTLKILEKPIRHKSLKTSWSNYNIANYTDSNRFDYLINETQKLKENNNTKLPHSKHDDVKERVTISRVCASELSLATLLKKSTINEDDVLYCFNSNQNGFFLMRDGNFYLINLIKDKNGQNDFHFSSRKKVLQFDSSKNSRPLSSQIIPNGCAIEFYKGIWVFQDNTNYQIENDSAISFRSYLNSIRYRNILSVVKDDVITLHAIYPFEGNIRLDDAYDNPISDTSY